MSFNGGGTFLVNSSGQPVVNGTTITSTAQNALTADIATGLSTCICKDGQTSTTARIAFALGINSTLTTDATSISTGSILTAGGASVTKALWVGGLANIAGAVTCQSTLAVTGAVTLTGGVGAVAATGAISTTDATQSTSVSTGSIVTAGGIGAAKALWIGGIANIAGALTGSSGQFTGALQSTTYFSSDGIILFAGSSASEVRLTRSTTTLRVRLGDDSADASISALSGVFSGAAQSTSYLTTDSIIYLGGNGSSHVSLRRSGTTLLVRKGDDSAVAGLTCGAISCTALTGLSGINATNGTFTTFTFVNGICTAAS